MTNKTNEEIVNFCYEIITKERSSLTEIDNHNCYYAGTCEGSIETANAIINFIKGVDND